MKEEAIEELKKRISQVLSRNRGVFLDFTQLSADELVQEINIYYQELEFQNEELKRVSHNLEDLKSRYEDLFMNAPVGYVLYDENFKILSMNNRFRNLIQEKSQKNQRFALQFDRILSADSQDAFYFHINALQKEGGLQKCRIKIQTEPDAKTFMMESIITESQGGKIFRSALIDISQEVKLELQLEEARKLLEDKNRELQQYHDRLEGIMLAGNLAWWQMDVSTGKVAFNENKTRMLGYKAQDFTHYSHFTKLVHPEDYDGIMQAMQNYLDGKRENYSGMYRIRSSDGSYRWFQDIGVANTFDKDGKPLSLSGVVFDITELKKATEEAQRASKVKSEFLANMSHEIRTPLNAVIGFTDLLRDANLTMEQREYLENAHNSAHTLLEIINDILDFSKIEAGKLDLEEVPWDLQDLLQQIIKMFKLQAEKKGLSLTLEIIQPIPYQVHIDPIRLKQVLVNLLSNAIKFTEKGSVILRVDVNSLPSKNTATKEGTFTFKVIDSGIGIPEEQRDRLFKAFSQGDTTITRRFGGTGLGLVISSDLVSKMGGALTFESQAGLGSTFYFSITKPYEEYPEAETKAVETSVDHALESSTTDRTPDDIYHILIADDVVLNRKLAEVMIKRILPRVEFYSAQNGNEAIELYKTMKPDIILMDIQMPVLDGYSATHVIRELEQREQRIPVPVIALSAGALQEEIQKAYVAGMDGYITKPIEARTLKNTLYKFLSISSDMNPTISVSPTNPSTPISHFERDALIKRIGGELDLFHQLIAMSLIQYKEYASEMKEALTREDFIKLRQLAHKFKGSALTMSCNQLASLLAKIETCASDDGSAFEQLFAEMGHELQIVEDLLQKERQ